MTKPWVFSDVSYGRECPYIKDVEIWIKPSIDVKLRYIAEKLRFLEFVAYLKIEKIEREDKIIYFVYDMYIPKQIVTQASFEVDKEELGKVLEYEGVVHLHPWRGESSFSHIDKTCVNLNHEISILMTLDGYTEASVKVRVPCGKTLIVTLPRDKIKVCDKEVLSELDKLDELIREKITTVVAVNQSFHQEENITHSLNSGKDDVENDEKLMELIFSD